LPKFKGLAYNFDLEIKPSLEPLWNYEHFQNQLVSDILLISVLIFRFNL